MAARPYIVATMSRVAPMLRRIISDPFRPGELPPTTSNQFRSGHYGKGAAGAGYQ